MNTLIKIIEQERERQGVSQKELAQAAGYTQSYYSQTVAGLKTGITLEAFVLLAERLNLDVKLCLRTQ